MQIGLHAETRNMDAAPKTTLARKEDDNFIGDRIALQKVILAGLTIAVIWAYVRTFVLIIPMQTVSMFLLGAGIAALNSNLVKISSVRFRQRPKSPWGSSFDKTTAGMIASAAALGSIAGSINGPISQEIPIALPEILANMPAAPVD